MDTLNIKINGIEATVPAGISILEACHIAKIEIPTLCYLKEINEIGACRICMVEANEGRGFRLVAACVYPVSNNMEILTNSPKVLDARKKTIELMLSTHERKCLSCTRSGKCELQTLAKQYGVDDEGYYDGVNINYEIDNSAAHMFRDNNKCILCRRCVAACTVTQGIGVIGANERGFKTFIGSAFDMDLADTSCVSCGQCINVCPTGALGEKDYTEEVFAALANPDKHVIVQTAPAVRAALGECFGLPIGTDVEGKMAAALRRLGFDKVFDTDFSADLTIMEEGTEFIHRLQNGGTLPLITSCSPGWIKFCEHYYPEFTENLSSCKSPQQMFGAVAKSYYAEKMNLKPEDIILVSVMPCTAKKFECARPEMGRNGVPDVDYVITTRELGRMIDRAGIRFVDLDDEDFDAPLGLSTGAAVIFGVTGGVMEAALRTVVEKLENKELPSLDFKEVRGLEGIKEASYTVAGTEVKLAIASSLSAARELLDKIKAGEATYHFIEIMGCPGGCINGGGQPQVSANVRNFTNFREKRASVLYNNDAAKTIRKSHENEAVQQLYKEYLGEPSSHKAHELLHTTYTKRSIN
ncbi:MAG: iron hydrogenase small subunit [Ruminococcus sp.]|nr:iron hydrogenase small subunit [Ruminococcus sp.]